MEACRLLFMYTTLQKAGVQIENELFSTTS